MTILLSFFVLLLSLLPSFLLAPSYSLQAKSRDNERRQDIDTIYTQLEQHYVINYEYPTQKEVEIEYDLQLPALDAETLKDPRGFMINDPAGSYVYIPEDCTAIGCKSFRVIARLENDTTYEKSSIHE